jgi:hypothetical protein
MSGGPDAGTTPAADAGTPDSGTSVIPDSGNPITPDAGTSATPDGGAGTACMTTGDCTYDQACDAGVCVAATTCSANTSDCPPDTYLDTAYFEECSPCPDGAVSFEMPDDPDAGMVCDGGSAFACAFSRCLTACESQADCPPGFYCSPNSNNNSEMECAPVSLYGGPTLAAIQCLTGNADAGIGCFTTSDCTYDHVCTNSDCVSFPSCSADTSACPTGTVEDPVYAEQCDPCPTGDVEQPVMDDPDAGIICASGTAYVCVADRCLLLCGSQADCPAGFACVSDAENNQVCQPIPTGPLATESEFECLGE